MIKVENITKEFVTAKKYPGFRGAVKGLVSREKVKKTAVEDVSFHIKKGEIVGYIGSNGAGKSTTIKMMTGIIVPTEGNIKVNGIDPHSHRVKNAKNIGVVFGQRTQLWWDLPLSETFTVLKEVYDVSDADFEERMTFLNDVLSLEDFMYSPVRTLSLGQRMRADLAAALLHNPEVLYLDEPTIGLDVVVKDKIQEAIREIHRRYQTTIILTTHDLNDIEELCDRIIIIDKGNIIYDGTIAHIKEIYGSTRKVIIELNDEKAVDFDFNEVFHLSKEDLQTKLQGSTITFAFNKYKINVSDIITEVAEVASIKDIMIEETEIEEIVKEIYKKGIMTGGGNQSEGIE